MGRFMLSLALLFVLVLLLLLFVFCCFFLFFCFVFFFVFFFSSLSIVIISLGEETAGLCASRASLCLFFTRYFLSCFLMSGVNCGL